MPTFTSATEIVTEQPTVEVAPESLLSPGRHWFRLVVEDDEGNVSQPAFVPVVVLDGSAPTAIFRRVEALPPMAGAAFTLDASESADLGGGHLTRYRWTVLPAEELP